VASVTQAGLLRARQQSEKSQGVWGTASPKFNPLITTETDGKKSLSSLSHAAFHAEPVHLAYQRKFEDGKVPLRKAWGLGDKLSLPGLSACYLGSQDFDGMKDLIPALMAKRKGDMESLNTVIGYAVFKPMPDRELFFQAIEGFGDDQLVRDKNVGNNTIIGLKLFGEKERAERLEQLKAKQDKGMKA
jgi:hypothetical protein